MKISRLLKNNKLVRTVCYILVAVLIVTAFIGATSFIIKQAEKKTKKITPVYVIGSLSADGVFTESEESIVTKNLIECDGLKAELVFNKNVRYSVYYYDENENFVTNTLMGAETINSKPEVAKYCRVLIKPVEDDQVKWYEVLKYSRQLKIEVNKVQKYSNLFKADKLNTVYEGSLKTTTTDTTKKSTSAIDVGTYRSIRVYVKGNDTFVCNIANGSQDITLTKDSSDTEFTGTTSDGNYKYYDITLNSTDRYVAFTVANNVNLIVFGIK